MKQNRIYYPSGIVSLILLPIMCIYYFDSKHIFDKFNAIPIVLFNPDIKNIDLDFQDDIMYRFHNDHFSNKKNINIYLKGEAKHDEIKTQYAQIVI